MGKCFSINEKSKKNNSDSNREKTFQLKQNIIINNTGTEIQIENKQKQILKSTKKKNDESKNQNSIIMIENIKNKTIIKSINQINGSEIKILNNENSIIIIMDNSSKVYIENCINCSIFISSCSSLISINKCEKINLISISHYINIINVIEGNFFIFSMTNPKIDNSKNIFFGMFYIHFIELSDIIKKSKINIWENHWSQFDYLSDLQEEIHFANDDIKNKVINIFSIGFNGCIVMYDVYELIPFTYGKNCNLNNFFHILLIFKGEDFIENDILKFLSPEELKDNDLICINTKIIQYYQSIFNELDKMIQNANNENLINFITKRNINKAIATNSVFVDFRKTNNDLLNELDIKNDTDSNKNNNLKNEELLLIWLGCDNNIDDINLIKEYINNYIDEGSYAFVSNDDVNLDNKEFCYKLKKLFEFE